MKHTMMLSVLGLLAMLLIAGCPRDNGNGSTTSGTAASQTATTQDNAGDMADTTAGEVAEITAEEAAAAAGEGAMEEGANGEGAEGAMDEGAEAADDMVADETETDESTEETAAPDADKAPPQITTVVLETTKGNIELEIHHDWSPLGAAHFIELVNAGFYNGAPWFRVMEGFVAQCGISADPAMNDKWMYSPIKDEPVLQGNKPGYVAFGNSGPDSRTTHIFINYGDNSGGLDRQGFSCFARVSKGMDVALSLHKCVFENQGALARKGGLDIFKAQNPQADYINKAYVK